MLLLGLSIERNAFSLQISTQSYSNAHACADMAIRLLQNDLSYTGNESVSVNYAYEDRGNLRYATGSCIIRPVGGSSNNDRVLCTESTFGNFTTRRLEINIDRVLPSTEIESWNEVDAITQCDIYDPPECGDNTVDADEQCDDGNTVSNDGCSATCITEYCGDSIVQTIEDCDDGAETADCDSDCTTVSCGDGLRNATAGEDCDGAGETAACNSDCTTAVCGDTKVNATAGEDCDPPPETTTCDLDCTTRSCGDGTVNSTAGEQCDDGDTDSGDGCSALCQIEACGNSVVDSGEQCDEGDTDNGDGCDENCQDEVCGNGIHQSGEECDDGDTDSGDGCSSTCTIENAPDDYIAYWKLDNNGDDELGNYDGTEKGGMSYSTDVPTVNFANSHSIDLDGSNDRLQTSNNTALFPDEISISFWAKTDSAPADWDAILAKANKNGNKGWGFYYHSGEVRFFVERIADNYAYKAVTATDWNHIVGTYNDSTGGRNI